MLTSLADLGLAPLGDYGGPTQTMALLPGHAAIGKGTPSERDHRRPAQASPSDSPVPDIGAFQTNPLVVNTTLDGSGSPSGDLSLRQAVNLANTLGGPETITFDSTVFARSADDHPHIESRPAGAHGDVRLRKDRRPGGGVTISGGDADECVRCLLGCHGRALGPDPRRVSVGVGVGLSNDGTVTLTGCTIGPPRRRALQLDGTTDAHRLHDLRQLGNGQGGGLSNMAVRRLSPTARSAATRLVPVAVGSPTTAVR